MRRIVVVWLLAAAVLVLRGDAAEQDAGQRQAPAGFTPLFDGKDLSGWKNVEPGWKVENGTIHFTGLKKGAKNLATAKDYGDFELFVDWKIDKAGDSGIYLRGVPQVQIWDSDNLPPNLASRKEDEGKGSGSLWNNPKDSPGQKPILRADNPVGQWNTFYIKMVGDRVTVKLNDKTVVDDVPLRSQGKAPPSTGPIELQVHGEPLWFRNIFVREVK
jgi:hypothetical protein